MGTIATFQTTKGTKTWQVSPSRIVDLDGFSTSFELNAESNKAVEGSPLSNQRGLKKKPLSFSSNIVDAAGVNVRSEFESWESWIGLAGIIKIGGKRFGASTKWLLTAVKASNVLIDSSGRWRKMTIGFTFEESDGTDGAGEVAAAVNKARSAAEVTAKAEDKAAKKPANTAVQQAQKTPAASSAIALNDVVQFTGGPHYISSTATSYKVQPKAGPAKVTAMAKGARHPYHVIHTDSSSTVYGWVDASQIHK